MRIAVIGAGPAGLTAALQLTRGGAEVDVYEASSQVGGLARSIDLWGRRVDVGPHRFFSTDARVNRFWLDIVGSDYHLINRLTRIHYNEKLFEYPLKPLDVFSKLGLFETAQTFCSYANQALFHRRTPDANPSFESWVVKRFGKRLYQKFFRSYSEKLWGIPCTELSEDFAAQRIRKLTLRNAVASALFRRSRNQHRTLADCFAYPNEGTGMVYERMAKRIQAAGGRVLLDQPIQQVAVEESRVIGLQTVSGEYASYDHVISTMPLTLLVQGLQQAPASVHEAASQLSFRNTILVYLEVADSKLFNDQWLYIHDASVSVGRITNFNNWQRSNQQNSTTILCCEYWCDGTDDVWKAENADLTQMAIRELQKTSLLHSQTITNSHIIRIPRSYPVYRIGYNRHVEVIANFLKSIDGLSVIGRYGSFKYNNQDHSILMGLLAAENILQRAQHNLWDLNSDFESYQEQTFISDTGLVTAEAGELLEACP
ncbi:MAG: FAD-dependent oxidoreductase [Pirellulales bacterium]